MYDLTVKIVVELFRSRLHFCLYYLFKASIRQQSPWLLIQLAVLGFFQTASHFGLAEIYNLREQYFKVNAVSLDNPPPEKLYITLYRNICDTAQTSNISSISDAVWTACVFIFSPPSYLPWENWLLLKGFFFFIILKFGCVVNKAWGCESKLLNITEITHVQ